MILRGSSVPACLALTLVAALASFPLIERMRRQPIFDLSLLHKPAFAGGLAAAFGMNGSLYAIPFSLVLYPQDGLHYSALGTGVRFLVITGAATVTTIPTGRLSEHAPILWLIGPGLGLLLMRGLHAGTGWTHLIVGLAIAGAGSQPGHPVAGLDRRGRGAGPGPGHGLGDQFDVPSDRDRHLGGRARLDLRRQDGRRYRGDAHRPPRPGAE